MDALLNVLIETSWNVKLIIYLLFSFTSSINRNIVECKDWSQTLHSVLRRCINRNIVECKENRENISESNCKSINRNIVECKDDIKLWNYSVKRVLIETSWNVKRKRNR